MSVREITMYETPDGHCFPTQEEAEEHAAALAIEARIAEYLQRTEGTNNAKTRQAAVIRRFLQWEEAGRYDD